MSIHQEGETRKFTDRELLQKLAKYAAPYWGKFLICMLLAFVVVGADLGRTYLIKLTIDDHINGYRQPMVAADSEERLRSLGFEPLEGADVFGRSYARTKGAGATQDQDGNGLQQVQIVEIEGRSYMVEGWLPAEQSEIKLTERTDDGGGSYEVSLKGAAAPLPARSLTEEQESAFQAGDYAGIWLLGAVFLAVVIGAAFLSIWQMNLLQETGQSILYKIRDDLFRHLSRMHMSFYDRNSAGRIVVRVTQDTESLNNLFTQVIVNLLKDILVLVGIIGVMLHMSVNLTLLTFIVLPFLAGLTFWYNHVIRAAQRRTRALLSRLNSFLAENLSGMRITQLFVRERKQWEQFNELNEAHYKAGMRGTVINSVFQPAIGLIGNFAVAMLLWYGGIRVLDGTLTFGVVFAFTIYVRQFFNPLLSLAEKYSQVQMAMVGAERIFDLLSEKPAIVDKPNPVRLPEHGVRGEITFEHVWFAYNEEDWVLKDVSFKIRPGETTAFVGATGAGKSSIIQLINRFYDIQKGRILLDGIDIRDIALEDLRKAVGIVQQDVFLFTGSIADNVRLNEMSITDEDVREAARQVRMDGFIRSLPDGYGTLLGERGVTLSLGQRQLLSFARAIVFKPQVLILDEATSNIDTETELVVQKALADISVGRTTLIVAHRLSTIQHADQIVVMHKGKVREIGNHNQLLAQEGYYYRLHQLQFKDKGVTLSG
ncbi:ABC transporter ATP-binding protein [Paenibacillus thermotolerans]|uniref:ABC transporter ATP-binding protein n=1 Tax=Paenibacillus thermotolerans TaxID=3027807 RepID=UPI0023685A0A|nr:MULTISPECIES: ABC transporter ATP-binding protein [unclassified Paenibacillus]